MNESESYTFGGAGTPMQPQHENMQNPQSGQDVRTGVRYGLDDNPQQFESNVLDDLRDALSAPVKDNTVTLGIPKRPTISVTFSGSLDFDLFQRLRRSAGYRDSGKGKPNAMRLMLGLLSHMCVGIQVKGKEVLRKDGQPMTFASVEFHEMVGAAVGSTEYAIRNLYQSDGHIIQTANRVLENAGYSTEDLDEEAEDTPLAD